MNRVDVVFAPVPSGRSPVVDWHVARPLLRRLVVQLAGAGALLAAFGVGFWWIEPTTPNLADALWLAFVTASTIGYGDVVPTTTASRLLAVPVLLLGFAVLSMVTAAIAAIWVESQEARIEREVLRDLHAQVRLLRDEIASLREALAVRRDSEGAPVSPPGRLRRPEAR